MRSPLSGLIAALLVFAPLVAVPAAAIFGFPHFSSQSPQAQADELKFAPDAAVASSSQTGAEAPGSVHVSAAADGKGAGADAKTAQLAPAATPRSGADPFAEFNRSSSEPTHQGGTASPGRAEQAPQRWSNAADREISQNPPPGSGAGPADLAKTRSDAAPAAPRKTVETPLLSARASSAPEPGAAGRPTNTEEASTGWKDAVARLNSLGIRDYQLQPGEREGEFLFSCRLVSRSNPRVARLFEAEANEPLAAVEKVLRQIDDWRGRQRSRSNRRAAPRDSQPQAQHNSRDDDPISSAVEVSNR